MNLISAPWSQQFPSHRLNRASTIFDAFGRVRISDMDTLFDSKLSFGKLPELRTWWPWGSRASGGRRPVPAVSESAN